MWEPVAPALLLRTAQAGAQALSNGRELSELRMAPSTEVTLQLLVRSPGQVWPRRGEPIHTFISPGLLGHQPTSKGLSVYPSPSGTGSAPLQECVV